MTAAAAPTANELGLKAFARSMGFKPSYATQLKNDGRLVLTADGKRVLVAESRALIEDTRDPAKAAVARRHALRRAVGGHGASAAADSSLSEETEGEASDGSAESPAPFSDPVEASHARRKAKAQADKAETDAKAADRDYRLSMGKLIEIVAAESFVQSAGASLRTALENMPSILAPELAATNDENKCASVLREAIEHALSDVSRKLRAIGVTDENAR